ncbi:hypothetical protein ACFL6R_06855, partial [Gemmatimonadota bacterium]
VSPVCGQTMSYSLTGHQRQMGPIERSLYQVQRPDIARWSLTFRDVSQDTIALPHAHAYTLIGGGLGGAAVAVVAAVYLTRPTERNWEYYREVGDYPIYHHWLKGMAPSLLLEPLGMATGVHLANKGRGEYWKVVGSSYGSFWVAAMATSVLAWTGMGRDDPAFAYVLISVIPIYQLTRTIRRELKTSGGRHHP